MKVFNKNNFSIHSLLSRGDYSRYPEVHVTNEFTEVTNGHFLVRVTTVEEKDGLPQTEHLKPSLSKVDTCITKAVAQDLEKVIPTNKDRIPQCDNVWFGQNTDEDRVEFISTD